MRGKDHQRGHQGGYVDPEAVVPADHPLRQIRPLVNAALTRLSPEFDQLYSAPRYLGWVGGYWVRRHEMEDRL